MRCACVPCARSGLPLRRGQGVIRSRRADKRSASASGREGCLGSNQGRAKSKPAAMFWYMRFAYVPYAHRSFRFGVVKASFDVVGRISAAHPPAGARDASARTKQVRTPPLSITVEVRDGVQVWSSATAQREPGRVCCLRWARAHPMDRAGRARRLSPRRRKAPRWGAGRLPRPTRRRARVRPRWCRRSARRGPARSRRLRH